MKRPTGVSILAILNGIGGAIFVIVGLIFVVLGPGITAAMKEMPETLEQSMLIPLLGAMSAVFFVFAAIDFIVAYGLWTGAGWGWWLYVALLALGIVSSVLSLPSGIVGIVINGLILYYMTRRHVKEYFGVG